MSNETDEMAGKLGREIRALLAAALVVAQYAAQRRADRATDIGSAVQSEQTEMERRIAVARAAGVALPGSTPLATVDFARDWAEARANRHADPAAARQRDSQLRGHGVDPAEIEREAAALRGAPMGDGPRDDVERLVRDVWPANVADAVVQDTKFGQLADHVGRLDKPRDLLARIDPHQLVGTDHKGRAIQHPAALVNWHVNQLSTAPSATGGRADVARDARAHDAVADHANELVEHEHRAEAAARDEDRPDDAARHGDRADHAEAVAARELGQRDDAIDRAITVDRAADRSVEADPGVYQDGAEAPRLAGKAHAEQPSRQQARRPRRRSPSQRRSLTRNRDTGRSL